jgi:hypothetical protein
MKSFILGGLVVLVMSACAPPFLEDLNRAAGLTGHMKSVGTVGSTSFGSDTNVRFYPTKPTETSIGDVNIQSGFVVSTNGSNDYVRFAYNKDTGRAEISGSLPFTLSGFSSPYPLYEYDVLSTTSTTGANIVVLDWTAPSSPLYAFYSIFPGSGSMLSGLGGPLNSVFGSATVYGAQMTPQPAGAEVFNFRLLAAGVVENGPASAGVTTGFSPGTQISLAATTTMRELYYMNPATTTAYTSYFSGGSWFCDQITPAISQTLSGVSNRIDALLTSGQLLSTQDGTLRLYDANGNQLFSKPLNGLQYCYEAYVGSTPYVFFSLPMSLNHGEWVFNVYAIATSSIGDLGK